MKNRIIEHQNLQFESVVSSYFRIRTGQFEETFQCFFEKVRLSGCRIAGKFYYSINSGIQSDGKFVIQVFVPIKNSEIPELPEDLTYHSYFQVLNLTMIRVRGDNEAVLQQGMTNLANYIRRHRLEERTPVFYLVTLVDKEVFTDIMVGVS